MEAPAKPETPEWLQEKRKHVGDLEKSVEDMQKEIQLKRAAKTRQRAKEDICFWMDNAIFPFLEGVAEGFNEPLLDGIRRLIRENKNPFRPRENWDRTKETNFVLSGFLSQPQTQLLQAMAKPFLKMKSEWLLKEASWIREEILKEEYPDFYGAIMSTTGGQEWLDTLITDVTKMLRRLIQ